MYLASGKMDITQRVAASKHSNIVLPFVGRRLLPQFGCPQAVKRDLLLEPRGYEWAYCKDLTNNFWVSGILRKITL